VTYAQQKVTQTGRRLGMPKKGTAKAAPRRSMNEGKVIAAVLLAMQGATQQQMADQIPADKETVRRIVKSDRFKELLHEAEREALGRVSRQVVAASQIGLRTLVEASQSPSAPWSARVSAARTLVELTIGTKVRLAGVEGEPITVQQEDAAVDVLDERIARMTERMTAWDKSQAVEAGVVEATVTELPSAERTA
jgi:hypothetical protein